MLNHNTSKTKEVIVNYRSRKPVLQFIDIKGKVVERVPLASHIDADPRRTTKTLEVVRRPNNNLHFLRIRQSKDSTTVPLKV